MRYLFSLSVLSLLSALLIGCGAPNPAEVTLSDEVGTKASPLGSELQTLTAFSRAEIEELSSDEAPIQECDQSPDARIALPSDASYTWCTTACFGRGSWRWCFPDRRCCIATVTSGAWRICHNRNTAVCAAARC